MTLSDGLDVAFRVLGALRALCESCAAFLLKITKKSDHTQSAIKKGRTPEGPNITTGHDVV
jgi:hypothetical protein